MATFYGNYDALTVERIVSSCCQTFSFITEQQLGYVPTSAVFLTTVKLSNFPAAFPSVIVVSFPPQLILKLTSDVHDWIVLWTSESKTVILV